MFRFLMFLGGLVVILYYLFKAVGAFFGQVGQPNPPRKAAEPEPTPTPKIHPDDIEDAEFEDIPEEPSKSETPK